jgi:hypothetical protein
MNDGQSFGTIPPLVAGEWYFRLNKRGKIHLSTEDLMGTRAATVHSLCGRGGKTSECFFQVVNPLPYLENMVCKNCFTFIGAISVAEKLGEE